MSGNSVAVVALDLHKKFTRAVTMGPRGEVMDDRRISHVDHAEMERFFREFEQETDILMEATLNWPWVADLAEKCGLNPHLGDPRTVRTAEDVRTCGRCASRSTGRAWRSPIARRVRTSEGPDLRARIASQKAPSGSGACSRRRISPRSACEGCAASSGCGASSSACGRPSSATSTRRPGAARRTALQAGRAPGGGVEHLH